MLKAFLEHIVKLVHHSLTPWLHFLVAMLPEDTTITAMAVVAEQVKVIATIVVVNLTLDFDSLQIHAV